jgi:hypothetical protein
MADENDNDHNAEFLDFFERLGPQCKSISELIDQKIKEALGKPSPSPEGSGSYLERQNEMLLREIFELKHGKPPTSGAPKPGPADPKPEPQDPPKPERPRAVWS